MAIFCVVFRVELSSSIQFKAADEHLKYLYIIYKKTGIENANSIRNNVLIELLFFVNVILQSKILF